MAKKRGKGGEFLLEVRCEEIPARMLRPAVKELGGRLFEELMARRLTPREIETGFTPRRLLVVLKGVPGREPDREEEVTGPPASVAFDAKGTPTAAALGFAKRCGVEPGDLKRVQSGKGEYVAAVQKTTGRPTPEVLSRVVPAVLSTLSWPKVMRWGANEGPWARPVHGIVALFDGEVVPFELFGVSSSSQTADRSPVDPKKIEVSGAGDYRKKLGKLGIETRFDRRRESLYVEMKERAERLGGRLIDDDELLSKLAAICAVPGVIEGSFDNGFLELPREVLITCLRDHQSAFAVESEGVLLPAFLTVMDRADDPDGRIRAGNEWVVAARLADARFFFDEDRKKTLGERGADLSSLTFHVDLGSYAEKTERIVELCRALGRDLELEPEVVDHAVDAAGLLKADLTTEMVKEFTSLQGLVGGIYARLEGHPEAVWDAVYRQYQPASRHESVPAGKVAQVVGLADRIDTLVGILGLGLVPSGSKDPFGLRRVAQGIVRIALEGELSIDLDLIAAKAYRCFGGRLKLDSTEVLEIWRPFLFDRVRHLLDLEGYAYDEIEAALGVGATNLPDLKARVGALHTVRSEPGFLAAVQAAKRIANIVRDAPEQPLDQELLVDDAEKILFQAYHGLKADVDRSEAEGRYEHCLRAIATFSEVLDRFFVEVLVMDENLELRNNRIALLQSVQRVLSRTAVLTEMVVEKKQEAEKSA